jgi:hypothetical protein
MVAACTHMAAWVHCQIAGNTMCAFCKLAWPENLSFTMWRLQEESRRLQMQSHVLQQRAMEMSLQVVVNGPASGTPSCSGGGGGDDGHGPYPDDLAGSADCSGVIMPLSQVHDLHAAMAAGVQPSMLGLPLNPHRSGMPQGLVSGQQDPRLEGMGPQGFAEDSLLGDIDPAHLPRHPPGDSTPSSVTSSSRVGLSWNIPSRGSIPSPSKLESFCSSAGPASPYLDSARRQPRCVCVCCGRGWRRRWWWWCCVYVCATICVCVCHNVCLFVQVSE